MAASIEREGPKAALRRQKVHPVECVSDASQRLVEAALRRDLMAIIDCLTDEDVDVNYAGAVFINCRMAELVLHEEAATEVRFDYHEYRTDASALFLAAHYGDLLLVRRLISAGADVNQKLFRGYAATAAAREGHDAIIEVLLKAGAGRPACEEALLEACGNGQLRTVELILESDLVRPRAAFRGLVAAACRGFVHVVDTLIKSGIDVNGTDRLLLQSLKPSLHANVDCTALVAAIVNRQVQVVHRLLEAGARTDLTVRLGAWSWDSVTGEEIRVGAGLAEPYTAPWCAVEYFEKTGAILSLLLRHSSPDSFHHLGSSLLRHAMLCSSQASVDVLCRHGIDLDCQNEGGETLSMLPDPLNPRHFVKPLPLDDSVVGPVVTTDECHVDANPDTDLSNKADASERRDHLMQMFSMDEKARALVLGGGRVRKHRKQGRGSPHTKLLWMDGDMGVLRWGSGRRRSVACRGAVLGGSLEFQRRRRNKGDGTQNGLFRVVSAIGKEVHFVCDGGDQVAELWVRGIILISRDAYGGKQDVSGVMTKKLCACIAS